MTTNNQELSNTTPKRENHPFEPEQYNPSKNEMALWTAVITQALMDAGSESGKPEAKHEKAKAIRWLLGNSEDFITVCQNAGLDPQSVRQKAIFAIDRGCVWRRGMAKKRHTPEKPQTPRPLEKKYFFPGRAYSLHHHSPSTPFPVPIIPAGAEFTANRY